MSNRRFIHSFPSGSTLQDEDFSLVVGSDAEDESDAGTGTGEKSE